MFIEVLSDRIGGNPGGMCTFRGNPNENFPHGRFYFKYCHGSRLTGASSFIPQHQPFYEAVTFELARMLGLSTADYFVLLNGKRDIRFLNWQKFKMAHNPEGRDCYFISRVDNTGTNQVSESAEEVIGREKIYLDALSISDIIGKRQNYVVFDESGKRQVNYVDLGCSFVRAVGGELLLSNRANNKRMGNRKQARKMLSYLRGKKIIDNEGTLIPLDRFFSLGSQMFVQCLNPYKMFPLDSLISGEEIDEIESYLLGSLYDSLAKFREAGKLK